MSLIAFLILTTKKRNYLGFLVLGYYAIFLCLDIKFFGFDTGIFTKELNLTYEISCLLLCVASSIIASFLFYKGNKLAGLYSLWLIYNSIICAIGTINGYGDGAFYFVYNLTQNINLLVDLAVVILGTDNILHRTRSLGNAINNINDRIDSVFDTDTH